MVGGPYGGRWVRISKEEDRAAFPIPKSSAAGLPPYEFDPPEGDLLFAIYSRNGEDAVEYHFSRVQAYERVRDMPYPEGYDPI
jgi:hypothetical protein